MSLSNIVSDIGYSRVMVKHREFFTLHLHLTPLLKIVYATMVSVRKLDEKM